MADATTWAYVCSQVPTAQVTCRVLPDVLALQAWAWVYVISCGCSLSGGLARSKPVFLASMHSTGRATVISEKGPLRPLGSHGLTSKPREREKTRLYQNRACEGPVALLLNVWARWAGITGNSREHSLLFANRTGHHSQRVVDLGRS